MGRRDQKTRGSRGKIEGGTTGACSSIENVLMHASPVNACQLLLLLLLLLQPMLHLRLILQQLPISSWQLVQM